MGVLEGSVYTAPDLVALWRMRVLWVAEGNYEGWAFHGGGGSHPKGFEAWCRNCGRLEDTVGVLLEVGSNIGGWRFCSTMEAL